MTTDTDTKMAWESVADRLDSLGLKLKLHFEQAGGQVKEVSDAFERLGSAIEETFSTVGSAVQDRAVWDDANKLATALSNALADTLSHAGQEVEVATKGLRCHGAGTAGGTSKELSDKS